MAVVTTYSATESVFAPTAGTNLDPLCGAGIHVDVVEADAEASDDAKGRGLGQELCIDLRPVPNDQGIRAIQERQQSAAVVDQSGVIGDLPRVGERLECRGVHEFRHDNLHQAER